MDFWQPNFEFYEATAGDDRAFVTIDLAAARRAPLDTHSVRLQLRVKMLKPRPDGLRSDEETDALFALEDKIEKAIREGAEGIYIGRVVTQGFTEFIFYGPALQQPKLDAPGRLIGDVRPYELEGFTEPDPEWNKYSELYPNPWAWQSIMNRRLLRAMRDGGDQLHIPRQIDHLALFPSEEHAKKAAQALEKAGFTTLPATAPEEGKRGWSLEFKRVDACDNGKPDIFVADILDLIVPLEGEYDGWGSPVQKQ